MKMNAQNRLLAILAALLWLSAVLIEKPWEGGAHERTTAQVAPLFPELQLQRQNISKIHIQSAEKSVTLHRTSAGFVVENKFGHLANPTRIIQLVDSLSFLDNRDVVSVNPEKRATFGVQDGAGTRIIVENPQGEVLADLIGGKLREMDPFSSSQVRLDFYVRPSGRDEVLLVSAYQPPSVEAADWLEADLFSFEAADITTASRMEFPSGESWTLTRDGPEAWRMDHPEKRDIDLYEGDSWAFSFANLSVSDVWARLKPGENPDDEYGFSTNLFRVETQQGNALELRLGGLAPNSDRFAWVVGEEWVYSIPSHTVEQLCKPFSSTSED